MAKRLASLTAAVGLAGALTFALAGCAGGTNESAPAETPSKSVETTPAPKETASPEETTEPTETENPSGTGTAVHAMEEGVYPLVFECSSTDPLTIDWVSVADTVDHEGIENDFGQLVFWVNGETDRDGGIYVPNTFIGEASDGGQITPGEAVTYNNNGLYQTQVNDPELANADQLLITSESFMLASEAFTC